MKAILVYRVVLQVYLDSFSALYLCVLSYKKCNSYSYFFHFSLVSHSRTVLREQTLPLLMIPRYAPVHLHYVMYNFWRWGA